jgi:uncharacterized RDD family membrane protein YckC
VIVRSPEGVELELPIAGPAPRIAAYALDLVLVAVMLFGILLLFALAEPLVSWAGDRFAEWGARLGRGDQNPYAALAPLLLLLLVALTFGEFLYFSLWEAATRGVTPGKYLLGLRVVGREGQPLELSAVLIRNALRAVDMLPSGYATGLVAMLISRHGQRLGDQAAGTLVIRTDRVQEPEPLSMPQDLEPLALSREQLARLGASELQLARGALRRYEGAPNAQRLELLRTIADTLATRLGAASADTQEAQRFLQRVVLTAERKRRG